eukprot:TRINITY_DN2420_c0_g1_i4.p1 TRINITY_DN2420_c0_g1~~TRINITY_DN2420_c0_g1_i4.p1  ORF type:complete len:597 (+),score=151.62 TRINITY_DN2420_c0_g1_i4:137-1927(+)
MKKVKEQLKARRGKVFLFVAILALVVIGLVLLQIPITNLSLNAESQPIEDSTNDTEEPSNMYAKDEENTKEGAIEEPKEKVESQVAIVEKNNKEIEEMVKQDEETFKQEKKEEKEEKEKKHKDQNTHVVPKEDHEAHHEKSLEELLDEADEEHLKYFANSVIDGGYRVGLYAGWRDFSFRIRTYKKLFWIYDQLISDDKLDYAKFSSDRKKYYDGEENKEGEAEQEEVGTPRDRMLWRLEKQLFPWAHKRYHSLLEMWKSQKASGMRRGIVVCVFDRVVRLANSLLYGIRQVHKSTIPIVIVHSGDELSDPAKKMFQRRYNATVMNVDDYVDADMLGGLRGFQIKEFALLIAPFAETMLVDADATFIQPPEVIFEEIGYKTEGAVFFTDRTGLTGTYPPKRIWVDNNVPHPISDRVKKLRWYNEQSSYEVESGVVLVDKSKRFPAVLASCLLMAKEERQEIFRVGYGDKEAFWQAFEMAGEPFYIRPDPPGCIGMRVDEHTACHCHILHVDLNRKPLWFNGGIVQNKNDINSGVIAHSHYAFEGRWDWSPRDCVFGGDMFEFPPEAIRVVDETYKGYHPDPVEQFLKKELAGVSWN